MTTPKDINLFSLVKSLTKGEKRSFKLFANRIYGTNRRKPLKFVQLFDAIDKLSNYDEKIILQKKPSISPQQLPNLKVFLYKQILTSLRILHNKTDITLKIREQIDFAKILYNKGLYQQSIKLLNKSQVIADKHNQFLLKQHILEFKKLIDRQQITKNIEQKISHIITETSKTAKMTLKTIAKSNISLQLYALFLKMGYARNEHDKAILQDFFTKHLRGQNSDAMNFFEKLYLYQAYVWYYLMLQDFSNSYRYGQRQLSLFHQYPFMIKWQPYLYIQSLNSVLGSLYFSRHYTSFCKTLDILIKIKDEPHFKYNFNISILMQVYYHTHIINKHFLAGTFTEGVKYIPKVEQFLHKHENHIDSHRQLIFYYKIACLYFGNDNYKNAIKYLNKVINIQSSSLRNDLHCFARILNLISHFELGNHELLEYQIRSTYRFLLKKKDLQEVQKYVLKFLRKTSDINGSKLTPIFQQCRTDLAKWRNHPYEKRAFLYLDFLSWLDAKLTKKPIATIIQEKAMVENR